MGRFFAAPYLSLFSKSSEITFDKYVSVFEKRENLTKLITILEKAREEKIEYSNKYFKEKGEKKSMLGKLKSPFYHLKSMFKKIL